MSASDCKKMAERFNSQIEKLLDEQSANVILGGRPPLPASDYLAECN